MLINSSTSNNLPSDSEAFFAICSFVAQAGRAPGAESLQVAALGRQVRLGRPVEEGLPFPNGRWFDTFG